MRLSIKYLGILGLILAMVVLAGCTAAKPSGDATNAANAAADRIFDSFNTGNYSEFITNCSVPVQEGINQSQFNALRNNIVGQLGKYQSRSDPSASVVGIYNNFAYTCQFENGTQQFTITMNSTDIYTVEGLHVT